jgi:hypothetical protein
MDMSARRLWPDWKMYAFASEAWVAAATAAAATEEVVTSLE